MNDSNTTASAATVSAIASSSGVAGSIGQPLQGSFGRLTMEATGSFIYRVGTDVPAFVALAEGQTVTDSFTYTPSAGGTVAPPHTLTITVTGVNDAPVATPDEGGTGVVGSAAMAGNVLSNDSDPDAGASLQVIQVRAGTGQTAQSFQGAAAVDPGNADGSYGILRMKADGSYTYHIVDMPAARALKAGETVADVFTYTVSDGRLLTTATVTFSVTGVNDGPTAVDDAGAVTEDVVPGAVSGNVLTNDADVDGGSLVVTKVGTQTLAPDPDPFAGASVPTFFGKVAFVTGTYGRFYIQEDGLFSYLLDNADADTNALSAGQIVFEDFVYTVADGQGGTSTATLRITVTGTNDAPAFAVATSGPDTIFGSPAADMINALAGDDLIQGMGGGDTIDGGAGTDTASYEWSAAGVRVSLTDSTQNAFGDAAGDVLVNIENLRGSASADTLIGDAGANRLIGNGGNDILIGLAGADRLDGVPFGTDTADYTASDAAVTIDLTAGTGTGGHAQGDTFLGIDRLVGSIFGDLLQGDGSANILAGGDGNDTLEGRSGADDLQGGAGADILRGGNGADTLTGGGGADMFSMLLTTDFNDVITDFSSADGDKLFLAMATFPTSFQLVSGSTPVQPANTTATFLYDTDDGRLMLDVDGTDPTSPFILATFANLAPLTAADIIVG